MRPDEGLYRLDVFLMYIDCDEHVGKDDQCDSFHRVASDNIAGGWNTRRLAIKD